MLTTLWTLSYVMSKLIISKEDKLNFLVSINMVLVVSTILESKEIPLHLCFYLITCFFCLSNINNSKFATSSIGVGIGPSPPATMHGPKVLVNDNTLFVIGMYSWNAHGYIFSILSELMKISNPAFNVRRVIYNSSINTLIHLSFHWAHVFTFLLPKWR